MKTARRQELRTNELSQQIDHIGEKLKKNWPVSSAVLGACIVLVIGVYLYLSHKNTQLLEGWGSISSTLVDPTTDPSILIDQYTQVANDNLDPALSAAAWLRVGDTAVDTLMKFDDSPEKSSDTKTRSPAQLVEIAQNAYSKVVNDFQQNNTATGRALMGLGVLAENQGNFAKAREYYERVNTQDAYKNLPFPAQAQYRLARLDNWARAVDFPPPPPPLVGPVAPLGLDKPAEGTPMRLNAADLVKSGQSMSLDELQQKNDASKSAAPNTSGAPAATTQPAGN